MDLLLDSLRGVISNALQGYPLLASLINALISAGVLATLLQAILWLVDKRKSIHAEREESFSRIYSELNRRYIAWLEVLLNYPHLGLDLSCEDRSDLAGDDLVRRDILYEMLFSLWEEAYINRQKSTKIYKEIWPGWESWIRLYVSRPSCRSAWKRWQSGAAGQGFNPVFQTYINAIVSETASPV